MADQKFEVGQRVRVKRIWGGLRLATVLQEHKMVPLEVGMEGKVEYVGPRSRRSRKTVVEVRIESTMFGLGEGPASDTFESLPVQVA